MNNEPIAESLIQVVEGQDKFFPQLYLKPEESAMRNMIRIIKSAPINPDIKKHIHSHALNLEMTHERRQIEQAYMTGCLETIRIFVKIMKEPDPETNFTKLSANDFIHAAEQFYLNKYDV